jgi:DNA-binding transcriptional ArsR family regulator
MSIDKAFRVLSNPIRLKIFENILEQACECDLDCDEKVSGNCVTQIAKDLNIAQPTVSNHVKELLKAELVVSVRKGKNIYLFGNDLVINEMKDVIDKFSESVNK